MGACSPGALHSRHYATARILVAISLGMILPALIFLAVPATAFRRSNLLYAMIAAAGMLVLGRVLDGQAFKRRVVVLGAGSRAARRRALAARLGAGSCIVGVVRMAEAAL